METVQIELPTLLAQRLRQEISHKALSQVVAEALQFWLEKKVQREVTKIKYSILLNAPGW